MTKIEPQTTSSAATMSVFNVKANRKIHKEFITQHEKDRAYIAELEKFLHEKGLELPEVILDMKKRLNDNDAAAKVVGRLMADGSLEALTRSIKMVQNHTHQFEVAVQYRNLTFWNNLPTKAIPTMWLSFRSMLFGPGKKHRVNIINDLTGRILPKRMTLVMGPPGSGKSTFLKALAGQLNIGSAHLDGEILYNGDSIDSGKYLVGKLASYAEEKEQHAATLTVRETLEFAWKVTTGGHHSYGVAKDEKSAEILNNGDEHLVKVNNMLKVLGLFESADTLVGNGMIRGISGGQKRRVTLGEMLLPPRNIMFLDAISNGLDAATTYDIVQALSFVTSAMGSTTVISLLQPAPDVFYTFADVIVMADGQIIYHGPTESVLDYFQGLGYQCPEIMDVADYLQEIPTADGKRFTVGRTTTTGAVPPLGTEALVQAWKASSLFQEMMEEMNVQVHESTGQWPAVFNERYPSSWWYSFKLCLERETKLLMRNTPFLTGRAMQSTVVGAIAGSLFNQLDVEDSNSMSGILFFVAMYGVIVAVAMMPVIYEQRNVFYKHSKGLFYPTPIFVLAQTAVTYPLAFFETVGFTTIVYWSVGMSDDFHGSRYFTFMFAVFAYNLACSQLFRLVSSCISTPIIAQPMAGVALVLMVLFSGFIIPFSNIPPGWEWFYWINPVAYVLKAIKINEFLAPEYDFITCDGAGVCQRFGDQVLKSRGNPTDQQWVWYCIAVLFAMYLFLMALNTIALSYIRLEPTPPQPIVVDYSVEEEEKIEGTVVEIPFEPATFSFKDVWYTVTVGKNEELDLLRGVSGFCEPGTVTALMGSSGAGKTTLLDVLSGRKNTGVVKGGIYVNGKLKEEKSFRRMMGYVEQFDTLLPNDTAREAIEFSAALRLPPDTPADIRAQWVTTVLTMLELTPLENTLIGSEYSGGMSFEQKKRVSIGVELAANPSILFLDEPTSGLDSRSAQVVIRCIKRVAASGRSIVCTIHQPSAVIFDAFDALLLLKRGGQTVFFGDLGEYSINLVEYFESIAGVAPKARGVNPATWMLEVIGAGTSAASSTTDFHAHYKQSALCEANTIKVNMLCPPEEVESNEGSVDGEQGQGVELADIETGNGTSPAALGSHKMHGPVPEFNATYWTQFRVLMYRFLLSYWRSPSYNFVRMIISIVIALLFSSAYAGQNYSSDVDVISRVALIYITVLFMGVVGLNTAKPVIFAQRPAFYREQYSNIYDAKLYTLAGTLVEIPYLLVSSVFFVIPYFWIVGFDKGDVAVKFFWYWLFQGLFMSTLVFFGHLLATILPNEETAHVLGGTCTILFNLFCGFMIKPVDFPDFWIFMYWLNPLHYVIEGLVTTQFNRDHTLITITDSGEVMTAQSFVSSFYEDWKFETRGYDILALCLFLLFNRVMTWYALVYVRHDKR